MEKAKSALLAALVGASLLQSYLLAYSEPKFDTIIPTDYVESKLEGTQNELSSLLYPQDIVLHFGNGEHTVLYPRMIFYRMILEIVEQRTFDGLRAPSFGMVPGNIVTDATQGIEIRFASPMAFPLLQQMMNLKGDVLDQAEPIDRIYIYTELEREEVRVFFASSQSGVAYEATRADLTIKDVERFVGFGEARTRYRRTAEGFYLPLEAVSMVQYRYPYRQFTADQLQRSLFPDPFSTRNLIERDGSEIFTDGKRGLQFSNGRTWMSYTDPAAPIEGEQTALDTSLAAVQFVNRHGGWNGDYLLESVKPDPDSGEQVLRFRHYIGSYPGAYPIIGTRTETPFGRIDMVLRNRVVTRYERSTVQLEGNALERESVTLPGGEGLLAAWSEFPEKRLVRSLYPAYRAVLSEGDVLLEPLWVLELIDGTTRAMPGGGAY